MGLISQGLSLPQYKMVEIRGKKMKVIQHRENSSRKILEEFPLGLATNNSLLAPGAWKGGNKGSAIFRKSKNPGDLSCIHYGIFSQTFPCPSIQGSLARKYKRIRATIQSLLQSTYVIRYSFPFICSQWSNSILSQQLYFYMD